MKNWIWCCLPFLCSVLLTAESVRADELCLTGNARRHQNLDVPFQVEPERAQTLFDRSHLDRCSVGFPENSPIVVSFAEPVRVTQVRLVYYNDPQRSYNAGHRARATGTRKGEVVERSPWTSMEEDAVTLCGADDALVLGAEAALRLGGGSAVDRLVLEAEKKPEAYQCLLREVTVWGLPERLASASRQRGIPVGFHAVENTYSSIRVAWSQVPSHTEYVRIRYRKRGASAWEGSCFTQSPGLLLWLRPQTQYELTAEAIGGASANQPLPVRTVALPAPLSRRTMADAWGMNFFPGGGGAHQPHADETDNTRRMIDLMQAAGVRHVRWWLPSPGGAELFAEAGMSLFPCATYDSPEGYRRLADTTGVWLTSTMNEPDFSNVFAADFVSAFLPSHVAARRFSPLMTIAGPAVGGELVGPGADYLAGCYRAGLKNAVDVIDVHPYAKNATPAPPGGTPGCPEGLIASLASCRRVMREAGDAARPVLATESGHPTHEGEWFMPSCSYAQQAQRIVRTHLILLASGVQRFFWYAFQDEGTDRRNPEHCMGIVDWHGNPKPAYDSYRVMRRLLGASRCEGFEPFLKPPVYGVRCSTQGPYITALWDCGGRSEIRVSKGCEITSLISLYGKRLPLPVKAGGSCVLTAEESIVYVTSGRPLRYLSQRRLSPPVEPQVQMTLLPSTVLARPGQECSWQARVSSEFNCEVQVTLECGHPWGGSAVSEETTLPPKGSKVMLMRLDAPTGLKPQIVSWDVRCLYHPLDSKFRDGDFRRALFFEVSRK